MNNVRLLSFFPLAAVLMMTVGCGMVPKIKIAFTSDGKTSQADPKVALDLRKPLGYGHTLKLAVYRNLLSRSRVFDGSVMVGQDGMVQFKTAGSVRVGGRSAYDAVKAIEAAFSRQHGDSTVSVQLVSIEDVPVVTVAGAVGSPSVVQWFDHMTADDAARAAGGRKGQHDARAAHITRNGARHFHAEGSGVPLKPGDVVNFSKDL